MTLTLLAVGAALIILPVWRRRRALNRGLIQGD